MNRKWMIWCAALGIVFAAAGITPVVCRPSAASSKAVHKASRYLYLVRHGEYDHKDRRDAEVGKALVPLGIAQARLVAARLESLPVEMTALRSSTMTRARQTALIIGESFPQLELEQSRLLIECSPRTWRKDVVSDDPSREMKDCIDEMEKAFADLFVPSPDF
ncbi:MAG: phosphoglycerate mutase family protein, partial [bacterium]